MKTINTFILLILFSLNGFSQISIFSEDFGNTGYFRGPANTYSGFSSDKSLFSADSIGIHNWSNEVSDYPGASGQSFALCGYHNTNMIDVIQIGPINTSEYSNLHLSYGAATWHSVATDYLKVSYSTNGSDWTRLDINNVAQGQYNTASWGYVELAEELPSSETLYIKFHVTSTEQTVRLDDITLTGLSPDVTPPSQPTDVSLIYKEGNQIAIEWLASTDETGIDHYRIYMNGIYRKSAPSTSTEIKYLIPGENYDITVSAVDVGGNSSTESSPLSVAVNELPEDYKYSWQKPHATVLPEGDLEWEPRAFQFESGSSLRYIDYEGGDDSNDGLSPATAWKHHPWDNQATGHASSGGGIHTYVFKRGVAYRGVLQAEESGKPGDPIRLTSDPSWGSGEAAFLGSRKITSGWQKSSSDLSPKIPDADKVWYKDISLPKTNMIVEADATDIKRVRIARWPNYQHMPEDPVAYWPVMTYKVYSESSGPLTLGDRVNFTQSNEDYYKGGTIWSQEDAIVMCSVWGQEILSYNPDNQTITVRNNNFGGVGSHYYIENTPYLLDTTSEFYFDDNINRLYLRLDGDKDPNTTTIEVATRSELIKINSQQYIEISGLSFAYTSSNSIRYGYGDVRSAIRMEGSCNNIKITNNKFYYINGGVSVKSPGSEEIRARDITVADNDFQVVDDLAMVFEGSDNVYLENVQVLRNRIFDNGGRQRGRWYSSIPAIWGQLISGEAAGNIVTYSWGNGLNFFWGKGGSGARTVPFIRGFMHHNKASHTLLGTNDYGGIESWQGGPLFCFNNISHNAYGYKHYNNSSIGEAFYFDGSFKHSIFNNIASGKSQEKNNTAFMMVLGYHNMYIHNTGYNTKKLFASGSKDLRSNGYNVYLSNVSQDNHYHFYHMIYEDYVPFEGYAYNVVGGADFSGSLLNKGSQFDLKEFRSRLENFKAKKTQTGWEAAAPVLENPGDFDFRPRLDGEAIDRGVKFFTAFPLSAVVGEWGFQKIPSDTTMIAGENFYMTNELNSRTSYHEVPKNHLKVYNLTDSSYRYGKLEDWTEGALYFDGASTYCELSHTESSSYKANNVDMEHSDLILEVYLNTEADHTNGVIISKSDGTNGYELGIDNSGKAVVKLISGGSTGSLSSNSSINTGDWYHILAEINRSGKMNIYLNGVRDNGTESGSIPGNDVSISNSNNLLIGKNAEDDYFNGTIDFLRISKGTLADARTTPGEIFTWLSNGPYHYDFTGNEAIGTRDAGAVEAGIKNCSLSVSEDLLEYGIIPITQKIKVNAADGFSIYSQTGDFYTSSIEGDSVSVTVEENDQFMGREGELIIYGCNESERIRIAQEGAPCEISAEVDTVFFDHNESTVKLDIFANAPVEAKRNSSFFSVFTVAEGDSIEVSVRDNNLGPKRTGEITLIACDKTLTIPVVQAGDPNSTLDVLPEGFEVYPNPVDEGILFVRIPETIQKTEIVISDLSGKQVFSKAFQRGFHEIELNMNPGIYMLRIKGNGNDAQSKLIIL